MKINIPVLDIQEFQEAVERIVRDTGTDYLDAVLVHAERNKMEIETVAALVKKSSQIKTKITAHAANVNAITSEKTKKLDL